MDPNAEQPQSSDAEGEEIAEAIDTAAATARELTDAAASAVESEAAGVNLPDFGGASPKGTAGSGLDLLDDVSLGVKVELGRTRMFVEDVLRLNQNSIVELDKAAGDPVDIYVNDRHVARGEVLVVNDNFCVRVSEIISNAPATGGGG